LPAGAQGPQMTLPEFATTNSFSNRDNDIDNRYQYVMEFIPIQNLCQQGIFLAILRRRQSTRRVGYGVPRYQIVAI
jgi:hypothetical protein